VVAGCDDQILQFLLVTVHDEHRRRHPEHGTWALTAAAVARADYRDLGDQKDGL
jgi:hypothetical protein